MLLKGRGYVYVNWLLGVALVVFALLALTETDFCFKSDVTRRIEFVHREDGKVSHVLLRLPLLYPQRAVRID